jgi:tryptophanyl-tRNA synthetase
VSNLILLAAMCLDRPPETIADEVGDGGSAALKRLVIDAVNERFGEMRARRAALLAEPGHLRDVLRAGNQRAQQIAADTLAEVGRLMHTDYSQR